MIILALVILFSFLFFGSIALFIIETYHLLIEIIPLRNQWTVYLTALIIICILLITGYTYFVVSLINSLRNKRILKAKIKKEQKIIEDFINNKLEHDCSEDLQELIDEFKKNEFLYESLEPYEEDIENKMTEIKKVMKKLKEKEKMLELKEEKEILEKEIKELEYQKQKKQETDEEELESVKDELELETNPVFYKEGLDDKEIQILKQERYKQKNEYSLTDKETLPFFIKPKSNHSLTHIFLVWSIVRILGDYDEIEDIKEHNSVDADITFKCNNKKYAIEVETGNLLKKKKQLQKKITDLNKKYKDRWMFVVSNKNLLSKYRKYGLSTQRTQVEENIDKLINL